MEIIVKPEDAISETQFKKGIVKCVIEDNNLNEHGISYDNDLFNILFNN